MTCTRSKKDFNTVLIEAKFKDENVIPTTVKKRVQKRQTRQTTSKSKIIEIEDKEEDEAFWDDTDPVAVAVAVAAACFRFSIACLRVPHPL